MPKIPQLPISKESYITGFQLATPRVKDISVARARPSRPVDSGIGYVAQGLESIAKGLKDVSEVLAAKEELVRVSKSQHLQMDLNETFQQLKITDAQKTSDQTVGMLKNFQDQEDDLRTDIIPEGLDAKTTGELTQQFDKLYNRHALWIVDHTIRQSSIADNEARVRAVQNAHSNIATLNIGDSAGVDQEVDNVVQLEMARHPNLTENQIETNRRALQEDFMTFALTNWIIDNPTSAVVFWDRNQVYLKKTLPKVYPTMLKKMDIAREDSAYDVALATVRRLTEGDNAAAAGLIDKDDAGVYGLTAKQRLHLASTLRSIYTFEVSQEERTRQKKEDTFFLDSHKKYYNPETGSTNIQGALTDLEIARRNGTVGRQTYDIQTDRLLRGGAFSTEDSHLLMSDIDDRRVTTQGEILRRVYGTTAKPEPFYTALKARIAQIDKGFTDNYFAEAEQKFSALTRIIKPRDLPSGLAEKELLFDAADQPAFRRRLEAEARRLGYSAGDARILDLADDLLTGGWYSKTSPEFHPGEAPWLAFGEKYLRKWEYDAAQLFQEGEIHHMPKSEIATGGSLQMQELIKTPEDAEAFKRLQEEGVVPTPEYMKRALEIMASEKEE